jgi:hypothetical protein
VVVRDKLYGCILRLSEIWRSTCRYYSTTWWSTILVYIVSEMQLDRVKKFTCNIAIWTQKTVLFYRWTYCCSFVQPPPSSCSSAVCVEPRCSLCGDLCTSRQTFLAKFQSCVPLFRWRWSESCFLKHPNQRTTFYSLSTSRLIEYVNRIFLMTMCIFIFPWNWSTFHLDDFCRSQGR